MDSNLHQPPAPMIGSFEPGDCFYFMGHRETIYRVLAVTRKLHGKSTVTYTEVGTITWKRAPGTFNAIKINIKL